MFDGSILAVVQQLLDLEADYRIVVIHPNFLKGHLLFGHILGLGDAAYVRIAVTTDREAIQQIKDAFVEQAVDPSNLNWLILDECDRLSDSALESTLAHLLVYLHNARILLCGRKSPLTSLAHLEFKKSIRYIPSDEQWLLFDHAQRSDSRPLLEVRAFGTGRVLLDGRAIDNWDGVLPRMLFFYLIDRGMVRRDDIFRTFWPKLNIREATNVFHVTKRKISEILGIDLTVYWSSFYRLSSDIELSYDVVQFNKLLQDSAIAEKSEKKRLLNQALLLSAKQFLTSVGMDWSNSRRQELLQMRQDACLALADIEFESGNWQQALGLYSQAAAYSHDREAVVLKMMQIYAELGMLADARQVYLLLEQDLQETLGIAPNAELRHLAQRLGL